MLALERSPAAPPQPEGGPVRGLGRLWAGPLWAHALAYGLLLLVLAPFMHLGTSFTSDEGAYALQARSLRDGTWAYDYQAEALDPQRRWAPVVNADVTADGDVLPYAKHPAYSRALQLTSSLVGERIGLHVLPFLGALVTAVSCWLIARQVVPGQERLAFWLGAATPVTINAFLIWAHAPSAAAAGVALAVAVSVLRRGLTLRRAAALAAALGAGVLLRSEGLLFAGALCTSLTALTWRRSGVVRAVVIGAATALPVMGVLAFETAWQRRIVGPGFSQVALRESSSGLFAGRVEGAWHSLLGGTVTDDLGALLALLGVAASVVGGLALAGRAVDGPRVVRLCAVGAAGLYLARLAVAPQEPVTGLLVAAPVLVLGLVGHLAQRDRGGSDGLLPLVAATSVLFIGAVLLSQYADGGGWQWGGRFFSPALPALAVLAAAGFQGLGGGPLARRVGVVLALAPTIVGFAVVGNVRASLEPFAGAVERAAREAPIAISTQPHLPRLMWGSHERIAWMVAEPDEVHLLLGDLAERGVPEVVVVAVPGLGDDRLTGRYQVAGDLSEPVVRERGWRTLRLTLDRAP